MATSIRRSGAVMRTLACCLAVATALAFAACGGDDGGSSSGGGGNDATTVVEDLAVRAEQEFTARGEGTFYDTGVMSYCRQNTGFEEGVFAALGYTDATAPDGYELCYNTSIDRLSVALGATSGGETTCAVLTASGGTVTASEPQVVDSCLP
jgi:hypothetical protein